MKKAIVLSLVGGVALAGAMAATTDAHAAPSFACSTAKLIVPWGPGGGTAVIFGVFEKSINATGVKPALIAGGGGAFDIKKDGKVLFSKFNSGRFPEVGEVAALIG